MKLHQLALAQVLSNSKARVNNVPQTIRDLREEGVWTVGVDMAGNEDYTQADYTQSVALVIGAEGKGVSRLVKERCDLLVSIPMKGHIISLNASVAAALVMYEAIGFERLQHGVSAFDRVFRVMGREPIPR